MSAPAVGIDRSRVAAALTLRATARGRDTALTMDGDGFPLALRRTGPHRVHLVGTGAWPLGGDVLALSVHVGADARLELVAVAATIALPGRTMARSRFDVTVEVESGGTAIIDLGPTVVAAGAEHVTAMRVELAEGARLLLRELVVLGRTDEPPGSSASRIDITVGTRPLIRDVLVRPAGVARPAVDDDRRALAGMVAVGFDPRGVTPGAPAAAMPAAAAPPAATATPAAAAPPAATATPAAATDWLALPEQRGWRSTDLDDDVAALQARDDVRWRGARSALGA